MDIPAHGGIVPADALEIIYTANGLERRHMLDLDLLQVRDWSGGVLTITANVGSTMVCRLHRGPDLLATRWPAPVPSCVPGGPGTRLVMNVAADGAILGWIPNPAQVAEAFGL